MLLFDALDATAWIIGVPMLLLYIGLLALLLSRNSSVRVIGFVGAVVLALLWLSSEDFTGLLSAIIGLGPMLLGIYRVFLLPRKPPQI